MSSQPRDVRDQMLDAILAAAPDDAVAEATTQLVLAATASCAQSRGDSVRGVPRPDTLGVMADSISDLSMQTGAHLGDVAHMAMCAAVVAARVSDLQLADLVEHVTRLWHQPMLRPNLDV